MNEMASDPCTDGNAASESTTSTTRLTAVVLISGSGTNLQALIDASAAGQLPLRIQRVISNRPQAFGLERARRAGIDTVVVDHREYAQRPDFEQALAAAIEAIQPQIIILAGFMRILGDAFVTRFGGRMINLHPSLLPKYRGLDTYRRALENGDQVHGASVHLVTAELDGGPVIAQARIPILAGDDEGALRQRLGPVEHRLLVAVTALFAQGRLTCSSTGRVLLDGNALRHPMVLKDELQLANPGHDGDHPGADSDGAVLDDTGR